MFWRGLDGLSKTQFVIEWMCASVSKFSVRYHWMYNWVRHWEWMSNWVVSKWVNKRCDFFYQFKIYHKIHELALSQINIILIVREKYPIGVKLNVNWRIKSGPQSNICMTTGSILFLWLLPPWKLWAGTRINVLMEK